VLQQSFFQLISQLGGGLRAGEIGQTTTQTIKFIQQFSQYDAEAVEPLAPGAVAPTVELERQFSPDMLRDVLEQFHHRQGVGTKGFMGQQQVRASLPTQPLLSLSLFLTPFDRCLLSPLLTALLWLMLAA